MDAAHYTLAQRQRWMAVLAHSLPEELARYVDTLRIAPQYQTLRPAETGLVQIQGRMGGTGSRFYTGDATLTRAVIRLNNGLCGYSWVLGRNKPHAERCAVIDALMQDPQHYPSLLETLIAPLEAHRAARLQTRAGQVNASRVDFFTLVRGDNA